MLRGFLLSCFIIFFGATGLSAEGHVLYLRENLQRAQRGDFTVTTQGKNYSLLHIQFKDANQLTIEEVSIPAAKIPKQNFSWKSWASQGFSKSTARVLYTIDLANGQLKNFYTFMRGGWYEAAPQNNFFPTLLNLQFNFIPEKQRRRVGLCLIPAEKRALWQPKMIVEGNEVQGINFDVWKALWPKDGSELSGKSIEIYLPEEGLNYPSYFPYWLQITGLTGGAKIRIVDSGTGLTTSHPLPYTQK